MFTLGDKGSDRSLFLVGEGVGGRHLRGGIYIYIYIYFFIIDTISLDTWSTTATENGKKCLDTK